MHDFGVIFVLHLKGPLILIERLTSEFFRRFENFGEALFVVVRVFSGPMVAAHSAFDQIAYGFWRSGRNGVGIILRLSITHGDGGQKASRYYRLPPTLAHNR